MWRDRDILGVAILWVALSVVAQFLVAWLLDGWPLVASKQGEVTAEAFAFLLRAGIVVFVLVALLIVYPAIRHRARADDPAPAPTGAAGSRAHRSFAWSWLAISAALNVAFIIYPGVIGINELFRLEGEAEAASPLEVQVTAQQWSWHFAYPEQGLTDVGELVLPVNRPVKFTITSTDVVHSFWVPAFGVKKDAIPGQTLVQYVTPTTLTSTSLEPTARVQCAELCGIGHAVMRASVRVVTAEEFEAWVAERMAEQGDMDGMPMESDMPMESEMPMHSGMPMESPSP